MTKLKIYALDDGRREFLVATASRKEACDLFGISESYHRVHGYIWDAGQVDGTDIIVKQPGLIFSKILNSSDPWECD